MRETIAAYPIVTEGRPDHGNPDFGMTRAKRTPKYVHGRIGSACLLHKVDRVELHWYTAGGVMGEHLVRLSTPKMVCTTICGHVFFIGTPKARTCELPAPGTVLCGRCHGETANFGKNTTSGVTKEQAKVRLGCIAKGVSH